jgi:heme oxygenase
MADISYLVSSRCAFHTPTLVASCFQLQPTYTYSSLIMGEFAKRLGQLMAAKSLESESSHILKTAVANKVSLSKALDGTLKKSHDMKVFGLGTLATMASRQRYARFTGSMYAVYRTMEEELDAAAAVSQPVATVWEPYGSVLRRSERLEQDWLDVQQKTISISISPKQDLTNEALWSPATAAYVHSIREAGTYDREHSGGRLLGHLYCRYFADLFGGSVLATPYRVALGLPSNTPRHYEFDFSAQGIGGNDRRALVEGVYSSINKAATFLTMDQEDQVAEESIKAFQHNMHVYSEEGKLYQDSLRGGLNVVTGLVADKLRFGKTA